MPSMAVILLVICRLFKPAKADPRQSNTNSTVSRGASAAWAIISLPWLAPPDTLGRKNG